MQDSIYDNGRYLDSNPGWHAEDSVWKASNISQILSKNGIGFDSMCEVGCGAGAILQALQQNYRPGTRFVGYEISEQAFEICSRKANHNLEFHKINGFQDIERSFDLAISIDVIEHVEDYFGFLKSLKEIANYKVLHIPLDISVQSVLRCKPIVDARKSVGHIHYFTKETALSSLADSGYNIIDYFYTAGSVELPSQSFLSTLAKFPRLGLFGLNKDIAVRILGGYSLMVLAK